MRTHFTYFPEDIQSRVIREHSRTKLLKATINPRRIVLVARRGSQIIGYAIGSAIPGGLGQFYWLYVDPDHRGQNTGLSLLSRMLKLQRQKGSREVMLATYDHRRYYERQGFSFIEQRLVDGVPMAIMTFRLGDH